MMGMRYSSYQGGEVVGREGMLTFSNWKMEFPHRTYLLEKDGLEISSD
jgi:hypothetical protein